MHAQHLRCAHGQTSLGLRLEVESGICKVSPTAPRGVCMKLGTAPEGFAEISTSYFYPFRRLMNRKYLLVTARALPSGNTGGKFFLFLFCLPSLLASYSATPPCWLRDFRIYLCPALLHFTTPPSRAHWYGSVGSKY